MSDAATISFSPRCLEPGRVIPNLRVGSSGGRPPGFLTDPSSPTGNSPSRPACALRLAAGMELRLAAATGTLTDAESVPASAPVSVCCGVSAGVVPGEV